MASPPAVAYRSTSGDRVPLRASRNGRQSEYPGRTKASRAIRALKQKPKHCNTFRDPAGRHSRNELLASYAKHFAMRPLQVAYKWTGKSISLLMSQSFAVTVTLDIFFERR